MGLVRTSWSDDHSSPNPPGWRHRSEVEIIRTHLSLTLQVHHEIVRRLQPICRHCWLRPATIASQELCSNAVGTFVRSASDR